MADKEPGKIVTFYSFKGGVGRTMAMANVAFIAAMNGMRVLVMDWDLEAPGLAYYFRALLDPQQAKTVKEAKGILNIFSEWVETVRSAAPDEVTAAFEAFVVGHPFADCAVSVVPSDRLPEGAALDYISAGSKTVQAASLVTYEEALANFSWQEFYEGYVGGAILEGLRDWSKRNYDLVLIDSRTGLADVAGICTMQLPDEVVLCFTFNRQNIDGVSRIAFSIRHNRQEQVRLRAIPMRTARSMNTPEESDAKARALSALSRVGGFSMEALQEDFKLAVRATDGVPFYETLSPLLPESSDIAGLSTNYRQIASLIVGRELDLPELAPDWKDVVRRRMQPRNATIDYIIELESADPMRATEELHRLLESALEDALDNAELDDAYIHALTNGAFLLLQYDSEVDASNVADMALDLLRTLNVADKGKWSLSLADGIERYWLNASYHLDVDQQVSLLDEADTILGEAKTLATTIRRLDLRRISLKLHLNAGNLGAVAQLIKEAWSLYASIKDEHELAGDQWESVSLLEADLHRIEGDLYARRSRVADSIASFNAGLKALDRVRNDGSRMEALRIRTNLHVRLSGLFNAKGDVGSAAAHAIRAANYAGTVRNLIGSMFAIIADPIIALGSPSAAVDFCAYALLQDPRASSSIATFAGRGPVQTQELLKSATSLARLVSIAGSSHAPSIIGAISSTAKSALVTLGKRRNVISARQLRELIEAIEHLVHALGPLDDAEAEEWETVALGLHRSPSMRRGVREDPDEH